MSHRRRFVLALALALPTLAPLAAATPRDKVDPWIDDQLVGAGPSRRVGVLVELAERPDLSAIHGTKQQKGAAVYRALSESAARAQAPLLARLRELGVPARSFWIANLVRVEADAALVAELAERDDVAAIALDAYLHRPAPPSPGLAERSMSEAAPSAVEWNVAKVNADDVWALGFHGESAVVAGQDTGYQWAHPALQAKYRGWDGASAHHSYNWHDAVHADVGPVDGNPCGFDASAPCDDSGHGTHTMGTMVGDDGGSNQIGLAPGARWIACRNMEEGWGTVSQYAECFQWFVAPTDATGSNPDPAYAPDVVNNSWGCPFADPDAPAGAECTGQPVDVLRPAVEAARAAGIVVVVSAGNEGSGCSTVQSPPVIYDAAISVGSTTSVDSISSFSSRGPVTADGSNRSKPDISAPGSSIRSSYPTSSYASLSGTSMAGPHVAGAVALILSAQPALRGDVDTIETLLESNALPLTTSQGCGGDTASQVPNNVFGWGRLDVLGAVQDALALDLLTIDDFETNSFVRWDLACPGGVGCV